MTKWHASDYMNPNGTVCDPDGKHPHDLVVSRDGFRGLIASCRCRRCEATMLRRNHPGRQARMMKADEARRQAAYDAANEKWPLPISGTR